MHEFLKAVSYAQINRKKGGKKIRQYTFLFEYISANKAGFSA